MLLGFNPTLSLYEAYTQIDNLNKEANYWSKTDRQTDRQTEKTLTHGQKEREIKLVIRQMDKVAGE